MNTQLLKKIRWLFILPLTIPLVSHAANDAFSNQLCVITNVECPEIPKEDEQGIIKLMADITKRWFQTAVEQKINVQNPTVTTEDTENPTTNGETTETDVGSTPGSSSNPIPNPMPAPQPIVLPPVAPKPPEKPIDVTLVEEPEKSDDPTTIQPSPQIDPNPAEPSSPTTQPPVEPTVISPVTDPNKDKLPTNPTVTENPTSPPNPRDEPEKPIVSEIVVKPTETPTYPTSTEGDKKADLCPQTDTFTVNCVAYNQVFENVTIETNVSVSQIQLRGQIVNEGMISSSTLLANSTLTGGKISGGFNNLGTVHNIHFVGEQLHGGILAGEIVSKGELQNVHLAANAHIRGESSDTLATLSGTIQGDTQHPALLEYVKIAAGAQVTGVKFGAGVMLDSKAIIELPSFENSWQVNKTGTMFNTTTKFSGGLSLSEPINFVKELTIDPDQAVRLRFNIMPEVEHIGQRAQVLFVVGTEKLDASGSCSAGTTVAYKVLLQLEQRDVDLYALPHIWIPQLVERHDENQLSEAHVVFSYDDLWQSKQLTAATCHYFFIGYRLAQDNTIVFDTTPLRLKVK